MKVKCILDIPDFTVDKFYDVVKVDDDGDIWVIDDEGVLFFMFPDECVFVTEG